jgi:metal-responsive CopG/Arc/MetJ family transcriptional regulator
MGSNSEKENEYVTVQIPRGLTDEIDLIIMNTSLGFRSRNEFCVDAVRDAVYVYRKRLREG